MPTVGEQLRTAREAQRLTIHRVAEATKMRTDHVRAIEEGRYDVFAAPVYLHGFVRAYARFLRLDEQALLRQLDEECGRLPKEKPAPFSPPSESVPSARARSWSLRLGGLPRWAVWGAVGLALGLSCVVWVLLTGAPQGPASEAAGKVGRTDAAYYRGGSYGLEDLLPLPEAAGRDEDGGSAGS